MWCARARTVPQNLCSGWWIDLNANSHTCSCRIFILPVHKVTAAVFFFSYLMVQIFILKFCWFKLWFNCSVVLIYGLSITALGVHSGTSICRNLEIKCWSLSVPLHLQCQSKRCTTACHFQHVLAPKYPPCPLRSRVVPLCSLLICLSKLQFVASLSEPRPRNVILQIRYTPLTVFSTPSQEVEIRLTVSLPPLSRARLGGGLLELGFHACLGIGRGNAAFCDLFMEKEKIGSDEGFIDGEIRAAWLHSAI